MAHSSDTETVVCSALYLAPGQIRLGDILSVFRGDERKQEARQFINELERQGRVERLEIGEKVLVKILEEIDEEEVPNYPPPEITRTQTPFSAWRRRERHWKAVL